MIDSSKLFLVEINVLVIHEFSVLFCLNVTKSFYRESGGGVGLGPFQVMLHLPRRMGLFSRCLRKSREQSIISTASQSGLQQADFLLAPSGHTPARLVGRCPRGSTHPLLPPLGSPHRDPQPASVSHLTLCG